MADDTPIDNTDVLDDVARLYPWAVDLGLVDLISDEIISGSSAYEIYAEIKATPQYKERFPAKPGWMDESEYLRLESEYTDILKEYGFDGDYSPAELGAFIEAEIDPNELEKRLSVYTNLQRSSDAVRAAFYVYAGLDVTVDDLYEATIDPNYQRELSLAYDKSLASNPLDYQTFITRATEWAIGNSGPELLQQLQSNGVVSSTGVSTVLATDPNVARQVMDTIYASALADVQNGGTTGVSSPTKDATGAVSGFNIQGGDAQAQMQSILNGTTAGAAAPGGGPALSLDELLAAFEHAMIGSAAAESGLEIPDLETVEALRTAGITRAQALRYYGTYASNQNALAGAAARSNTGQGFDQGDWEQGVMLGVGDASSYYQTLIRESMAYGRGGGNFGYSMEGGRIAQTGRKPPM